MPFTYNLPSEYIAQRPCHPADAAKMLVVDRAKQNISDSVFSDITYYLRKDDLLVFNDSRVIPARLFGKKDNIDVELLLLEQRSESDWLAIGRPLRKLKVGTRIDFVEGLKAEVIAKPTQDRIEVRFFSDNKLAVKDQILQHGLMPIPPYIRNGLSDKQDLTDYQTIFAKNEGSIAAPTASLHFTPSLISAIQALGCEIEFLTLHVGLSSIKEIEPGKAPEAEKFNISDSLRNKIKEYKKSGRRIIGVGTTAVRALESIDLEQAGETGLFIQPGYSFKTVDCIITNFHMPQSTHLQLVQAFMGSEELISNSYQHAISAGYRFLSYGDGMMIL